jgi:hypothetical protein
VSGVIETGDTPGAADYPLHRRVIDVFVAPGRLFENFRHATPWVGPLVISVVVGLIVVFAIPQELYVEQARETIRNAPAGAELPAAETLAGFGRLAGAASVLFGVPIGAFVMAGVLALIFGVFFSGEARFTQFLTLVTHTQLIGALGTLVTLPVQLATGSLETRLSLALLAPGLGTDSIVGQVLAGLDVFTLWTVAVVGLGIAIVNRKPSWAAASGILFAVQFALVAAFAAIAAR